MSLFERRNFVMHSGEAADFKIECDALSDEDIETFALLISTRYTFRGVIGVPTGGRRIASALQKYCNPAADFILLVDDVYTTGRSMDDELARCWAIMRDSPRIHGVVLFARKPITQLWISAVFQLWS